jgi:hypothetical protein
MEKGRDEKGKNGGKGGKREDCRGGQSSENGK